MLKIDQFHVNKDRSFSTILCFENYINAKISQKDLLRDEKIFLRIKNDAFHVISCQFLHFDEFYTLSYLYRVKLGSMSKFHKSCLSASLKWDTLIFEKIMLPNETYHISSLTRDFLSAFSMISFMVCILFDGYSAIESCVHSAAAILVY